MPAGRPKSESTRIKELEAQVEVLKEELESAYRVANQARETPQKMSSLFCDIWILAQHINENAYDVDEGLMLAQLKAIECMAHLGSEMDL